MKWGTFCVGRREGGSEAFLYRLEVDVMLRTYLYVIVHNMLLQFTIQKLSWMCRREEGRSMADLYIFLNPCVGDR